MKQQNMQLILAQSLEFRYVSCSKCSVYPTRIIHIDFARCVHVTLNYLNATTVVPRRNPISRVRSNPTIRALASEEFTSLISTLYLLLNNLLLSSRSSFVYAICSAGTESRRWEGLKQICFCWTSSGFMFSMLVELGGEPVSVIQSSRTESGDMRDAILGIEGEGAYNVLRWDSAVHCATCPGHGVKWADSRVRYPSDCD
ncbi:uncharacterized protein EDB91DRAFT_1129620 [Suillus paluster]|uniref:uncharacterized protein n=1 Tax=Suillus paluster TaxID=48578 RepID=UPI001B874EB8|nr:uncharacterized protein EDB91DRAFT_1129620 [Suillus paluster]KAG1741839.1 hypothetical protein EDB91DRAFT_1129620 [Suillus paluster]